MKRYIKASASSGLVGIWWIKDDVVIADLKTLDNGYNDGSFINYDERKNHLTEWKRLVKQHFPDEAEAVIAKGYKSLDRGRVVYNLRTQCYEVLCGEAVFKDSSKRQMLIDTFELSGCRYDFVNLGTHYHIAELTGNPKIDQFEYEM